MSGRVARLACLQVEEEVREKVGGVEEHARATVSGYPSQGMNRGGGPIHCSLVTMKRKNIAMFPEER